MRMRQVLVISVLCAMALVACSDADDRPAAGGGATTSGPVGGSGSGTYGGGTGGEGGASSDAGAVSCTATTQQGASISEILLGGQAPAALGGAITPGTYVLTELDAYGVLATNDAGTQTALTGVIGRATVIVTSTSMTVTGARGASGTPLPADTVQGTTFTIDGTTLRTTPACPSSGAKGTISFSAVGGGLALFIGTDHRELYTLL